MVGGDFQKPLHLLVAYGYYAFKGDVRVDPSDVADERPIDAIITFSELFVGPCIDRSEVIDEGSDHAEAHSLGVLCWGYEPPCASVL